MRHGTATGEALAGGGGFEPPLPGPEPGVLPLDDPPPKPTAPITIPHGRAGGRPVARRNMRIRAHTSPPPLSPDRRLQRPARLEPRHPRGRNRDLLPRAGIPPAARRALAHAERSESADRHATTAAERVEDRAHEGVHRAVGRALRAAGGLGHLRDELRLCHRAFMSMRRRAAFMSMWR